MTGSTDDAHAEGEQGPGAARTEIRLRRTDESVTAVFRTAAWIPPAYRQAYLEGAASVLGRELLADSAE
jgi:hypothetical protein